MENLYLKKASLSENKSENDNMESFRRKMYRIIRANTGEAHIKELANFTKREFSAWRGVGKIMVQFAIKEMEKENVKFKSKQ